MSDRLPHPPQDHGEVVSRAPVRISWVWAFPLLAAAAVVWLFWSNWRANGPEIEVLFDTAPGIQAGKTPLIYRGVTAGKVTAVRLDHALDKVVLTVRLKAYAQELAREGTVFWIDQPVVGIGDTSGLDALIQGNSLQARMGGGPAAYRFNGVENVPLTPLESPALILKLRAPNIPFLDRGSPLFYRGVQVGSVESKELDKNGLPYLRVVVEKEFARTVRRNARFWPVPATSIKVGPGGVQLQVLGIKSILLGGVEFDIFGPPGEAVSQETEFTLHADETSARSTGVPVHISFPSGRGLFAGQTQVRHLGVPVGYLESVNLDSANQSVDAVVRFQPAYENLHTAGATFTLMLPHISLDGVTGLDTLIGGPFIDIAPGGAGEVATTFQGRVLSTPEDRDGLHVTLTAKSLPPLGEGAPVLHRGLTAGKVLSKGMGADGQPYLELVIQKDFVPMLARNARFWQVPGAAVQAGPGLINLDIDGLESLLKGAIAFEVFETPAEPVEAGTKFELFPTEMAAKAVSAPIRISFDDGQGLLAGRTEVRYLGVPVGLVESVTPKNGQVDVVARLNAGYDFLRRAGSSFAVVRLKISLNEGISGLETALSGVYIECVPADGGKLTDRFKGVSLAKATFEEAEEQGLEVVVTSARTDISLQAPVSYRGLVVGKVLRKVLSDDGRQVGLGVVIYPPYDKLVRDNTKFWDNGGVKVSMGFLSIKVQTASIDAIARGGIAFATPTELGAPVKRGHEFELNRGPRPEWMRWAPAVPGE